jgi:proteic killer suppression protein
VKFGIVYLAHRPPPSRGAIGVPGEKGIIAGSFVIDDHDIQRIIDRKLAMLDAATTLDDLRSPPGNELEAPKRERKGQHSIRVNKPFRICFVWTDLGPTEVE